jgi:beta-N-acetylhexosaminidase
MQRILLYLNSLLKAENTRFKWVFQLGLFVILMGLGLLALWLTVNLRTPLLASVRNWLFWLLLGFSIFLTIGAIVPLFYQSQFKLSKPGKLGKLFNLLILVLALANLSALGTIELKFQTLKHQILNQVDSAQLQSLGAHLVVGYTDSLEVEQLAQKGAIAGVFITHRNVDGKTKAQIQTEIATWQRIRQDQGLPPLWIATDQEGGIVSRLSPPLTQLPPLAQAIDPNANPAENQAAVFDYGQTQAQGLAELGINLNFAPVVDLDKGIVNPNDRYSQIYRRAISSDKEVVAQVATWYCLALEQLGVECTIKHFPGLGRVTNDTHVEAAQLVTPPEILRQDDWVPFRRVMAHTNAFTMLGHAQLMALDPDHPVSFSQPIIGDLVRGEWDYSGILITDDFCMKAVYGHRIGVEEATIAALNAGVDLILISYDPDQYYLVMAALLQAQGEGRLEQQQLNHSYQRLQQAKTRLTSASLKM